MKQDDCVAVVEVTRGRVVESIHYGAIAVVSADGTLLSSCGNPETVTFLRSSAKPLQVLPFLAAGGMQHFNLTLEEVALMCASHAGTDNHVRVAASILSKIGASEANLQCGTHPPGDDVTYQRLMREGLAPTPFRHNCSGKHSGFLAYATLMGEPLDNYLDVEHPLQQRILHNFAHFCDMQPEQVELGIDGCTAPVFAVPLCNAALAIARLVDPRYAPEGMQNACQTVIQAMQSHPDMIAGPGRFDTRLMQTEPENLITKTGAEGYQIVGILPGVLFPDSSGVGIALKISDGDLGRHTASTHSISDEVFAGNPGGRGVPLVTLETLRQLGILSSETEKELAVFDRRPIHNFRKLVVGEIRPCFTLKR